VVHWPRPGQDSELFKAEAWLTEHFDAYLSDPDEYGRS
jgi:hypothetical protein